MGAKKDLLSALPSLSYWKVADDRKKGMKGSLAQSLAHGLLNGRAVASSIQVMNGRQGVAAHPRRALDLLLSYQQRWPVPLLVGVGWWLGLEQGDPQHLVGLYLGVVICRGFSNRCGGRRRA